MVERYVPNLLITVQLAFLAMVVDLVFGFPFAYILVRRVRYRDVVRALMVFPMFGALYVAFGMRFLLLPNGALGQVLDGPRHPQQCAPVQPAGRRVRDVDLHVPVHGHEHRHGAVQRRPDARGGGRLPRRAVVADVLAGHPAAHPRGRRRRHAAGLRLEHRDVRRAAAAGRAQRAADRSPGRSTSAAWSRPTTACRRRWASSCWSSRSWSPTSRCGTRAEPSSNERGHGPRSRRRRRAAPRPAPRPRRFTRRRLTTILSHAYIWFCLAVFVLPFFALLVQSLGSRGGSSGIAQLRRRPRQLRRQPLLELQDHRRRAGARPRGLPARGLRDRPLPGARQAAHLLAAAAPALCAGRGHRPVAPVHLHVRVPDRVDARAHPRAGRRARSR